jgi:hypothetical protein
MEVALCIMAGSLALVAIALTALAWKRLSVPDWKAASFFAGNHIAAYNAGLAAGRVKPSDEWTPDVPGIQHAPTASFPPPTVEYDQTEDQPVKVAHFGMPSGEP